MTTQTMPQTRTAHAPSLELRRVFKTTRAALFDAWTKPELLKQWFGPAEFDCANADIDLRVDGAYRIEMRGNTENCAAQKADGTPHEAARRGREQVRASAAAKQYTNAGDPALREEPSQVKAAAPPQPIATGRYTEIVPNERLRFTWRGDWDPALSDTLITLEFKDVPGGTELILTQTNFANEQLRDAHNRGWNGSFDKLARFTERR